MRKSEYPGQKMVTINFKVPETMDDWLWGKIHSLGCRTRAQAIRKLISDRMEDDGVYVEDRNVVEETTAEQAARITGRPLEEMKKIHGED